MIIYKIFEDELDLTAGIVETFDESEKDVALVGEYQFVKCVIENLISEYGFSIHRIDLNDDISGPWLMEIQHDDDGDGLIWCEHALAKKGSVYKSVYPDTKLFIQGDYLEKTDGKYDNCDIIAFAIAEDEEELCKGNNFSVIRDEQGEPHGFNWCKCGEDSYIKHYYYNSEPITPDTWCKLLRIIDW